MCIIIPVSHIPCAHTSSIWQYCTDASRSTAGVTRPCWNVRLEKNGNLTSQLCQDCDNDHSIRGMNMRGKRNLHIITQPAKIEGDDEDGNDSGYHSDVLHEEPKLPDIDEQPLSPRTMSPRHCRQRKRTSSRQRTLARKSSWKPNLHSASALDDRRASSVRRDSIDSVLSSYDYKSWYSSANKMLCVEKKASGSESQLSQHSSTLNARPGRGSTLLHPSSPPPLETTANAQVAKAYNFPQIVNVQKSYAVNRPILQARKNSTLLHPSSPQEEASAEHNAASHFQHNFAETRSSRPRPAAPVRRASSLLHPSSPADVMVPDATATPRTILRVLPTRAVGSTKNARTRSSISRSRRGSHQTSRGRHVPVPQINPIDDSASQDMGRDLLGSNSTHRRRQRSILHSSLSDSDDSADDEDVVMDHGGINFSLDMFGQANQQRPEVLKTGVYEDFLLTSTAVAARQKRGFFRSRY